MAPIPAKVLEGLPAEAAAQLQRYVDSSERFQQRVYGEREIVPLPAEEKSMNVGGSLRAWKLYYWYAGEFVERRVWAHSPNEARNRAPVFATNVQALPD